MDKVEKRLNKIEERLDYLHNTIIPLLKKRTDAWEKIEVLLISLEALYEKKLREP